MAVYEFLSMGMKTKALSVKISLQTIIIKLIALFLMMERCIR